jgi:hypothetical protein
MEAIENTIRRTWEGMQKFFEVHNRFRPFFLFATPPTAPGLLTAPVGGFVTAPFVPEAGCNGPLLTAPTTGPVDAPFSFIGVLPLDNELTEADACNGGFGCRALLLLDGESWSGSAASTTAKELDFEMGLEGVAALSAGATEGAREDELAFREAEGVCSRVLGEDGLAVAVEAGATGAD